MSRLLLACVTVLGFFVAADNSIAQSPPALGDSAKAVLGSWEFSNADRDKKCTAIFKSDRTAVGYKVEFEASCGNLFPLVNEVAGWTFRENDLLRLINAQGKPLIEFSEVEDGIYEAPTPGVGVLFLQNSADAAPETRPSEELAGDWIMLRGNARLCVLNLSPNETADGFMLIVKPGCADSIARLDFKQWHMDNGELVLSPAHGNPWRFEETDNLKWRRLPESADSITLMKQP